MGHAVRKTDMLVKFQQDNIYSLVRADSFAPVIYTQHARLLLSQQPGYFSAAEKGLCTYINTDLVFQFASTFL
jgi:hypothetical protein